ncbi:MAG: extensin family protein [Beijerinckiaceae bacterium]
MRLSALGLALGCASGVAAQGNIPLPPVRPHEVAAPAPDKTDSRNPGAEPTPADNDALRAQVLASGRIIGESLAPIVDPGGCNIAAPLRLQAIMLADGSKVTLSPAVIMRGSLAAAVADWVRDDLAPALAASSDRLARIEGAGAYECRSRNGIAGAKLSEHAKGNALDLRAFVTTRGKIFAVAASKSDEPIGTEAFLAGVKATACAHFTTVLGPGSDPYHEQHLHVDLSERRSGARLCQWILPNLAEQGGTPTKR